MNPLDGKTLDLVTHGPDLGSKLAGVVARDTGSDDGSADTAGTAEVHLAAHINIGNLVYQSQYAIASGQEGGENERSCPPTEEECEAEWREERCRRQE